MRIRFTTTLIGAAASFLAGEVRDVNSVEAQKLIDLGRAELVSDDVPSTPADAFTNRVIAPKERAQLPKRK